MIKSLKEFEVYKKGSCAEVRSMLLLSKELNLCNTTEIQDGYDLSIEISQNLSNFIKYFKTK